MNMSASNMFNKTLQTSHGGVSLDKCTRISKMSTSPAYHGYGKTLHYRHPEYKTTSHGDKRRMEFPARRDKFLP